tara:strand:+ start:141 stop:536 length:396 start_codon:yes stop_codon:yes gene_type:complete
MTYNELKEKHQTSRDAFTGIFYAFSNSQFNEGMAKLGLSGDTDLRKIASIGNGGYLLKEKSQAFQDLIKSFSRDMDKLRANPPELLAALIYELRNHEYCITYDPKDALYALGLTEAEVDPTILRQATQAAI